MQLGGSGERFVPRISPVAWQRFGLHPSVLGTVMEQLDQQYRQMVSLIVTSAGK